MNRRAVALIFSFLVIVVLTVIGIGLITRSISEKNLVLRHVNSSRAFWLAEAGIAQAISVFDSALIPQNIGPISLPAGNPNQTFTSITNQPVGFPANEYRIQSTGTVVLPASGATIQRQVQVDVLRPVIPPPTNAVITTGLVDLGGAADILDQLGNPNDYLQNQPITFPGVFGGFTKAQIKAQADYIYTDPPNNVQPVNGITWIDLTGGAELTISFAGWTGNGILIIDSLAGLANPGELKFTGGTFNGIIWITGIMKWPVAGNATANGAVLIDCGPPPATTAFRGTCLIQYDPVAIQAAINQIDPTTIPGTWQELH